MIRRSIKFQLLIFFFANVLISFPISNLNGSIEFLEYWQRFIGTVWRQGALSLSKYVEFRTQNNFKNIRAIFLSEQLAYKISEKTTLEVHFTYVHDRGVLKGSSWK